MEVRKYLKLEILIASFKLFQTVKQKQNKTNWFVLFLGKSTAQQSAYGFIWPLGPIHSILVPFQRLFFYTLYRLLVQKNLFSSLNLSAARLEREMYQMIQVSFAWQTWWRLPILMVGSGSKEKKHRSTAHWLFWPKFLSFHNSSSTKDMPPSLPSKRNLDHLEHLPFKPCSQ